MIPRPMDGLDVVEVVMVLEEIVDTEIPIDDFADSTSPSETVDRLD